MNCSDSKNDTKQEKAVLKRKSSIFQSRNISFGECEGPQRLEKDRSVSIESATECTTVSTVESFDLKNYVNSLKEERASWLKTYKQRKAKRRNLTKQKLSIQDQGQVLDLSALSESERAFVKARPNYEQIYANGKKLSSVALQVARTNQLVLKLNQTFILRMEERLRNVTQRIIQKGK